VPPGGVAPPAGGAARRSRRLSGPVKGRASGGQEPADEQDLDRTAHADDPARLAQPLLRVQILTLHPSGKEAQ